MRDVSCFVTHGRFFALVVGLLLLTGCMLGPDDGPEHVFELDQAPAFLSEELALGKARDALRLDGRNPDEWQPTRVDEGPSKAPDGAPDKYLVRFLNHATQGRISFRKGSEYRRYSIRLEGTRLVSAYSPGL
jgi:hypothetical protein